MITSETPYQLQCPISLTDYPRITMAHGGGGILTHQLITDMFQSALGNEYLSSAHDGVILPTRGSNIAFTTDSHVVKPLFYPGGDIGTLAVYGTVNDLAMCGARPLYLSLSFIIEEGLSTETLWKIVQSIKKASETAGVKIVTGDTKVVNRVKGDELYINTTGVGVVEHSLAIQPTSIEIGDVLILSGDLGRHGIAVLAHREGLEFETVVKSDCAPLNGIVEALLKADVPIHCMRDLTRGGLVSALVECAQTSMTQFTIEESKIPVTAQVQAACEILGFDPLYVANEGRFVLFIPPDTVENALAIFNAHSYGEATVIGSVTDGSPGRVVAANDFGGSRILDMFSGEQLPRIC